VGADHTGARTAVNRQRATWPVAAPGLRRVAARPARGLIMSAAFNP